MPTKNILVVGAGGHGQVVVDALLEGGTAPGQMWVSDDDASIRDNFLPGIFVAVPALQPKVSGGLFHVAVGAGPTRQTLTEALIGLGGKPLLVRHPAAVVSRFADIESGTFLGARAIIGPSTNIGCGVIINQGAIVDHDSVVGSYSHIAPNATIGGGVVIGSGVLVGAGAVILPGVVIGPGAIIGAGAVVLRDVDAGVVCVGVPAKIIGRR